jgi:hypothetical protein
MAKQPAAPVGTWQCHFVDQFQSDEARGDGEPYPDDGTSAPAPVAETPYRAVTLELEPAGAYKLTSPERQLSAGTWAFDNGALALVETENGDFDSLYRVTSDGKSIVLAFRLIPDAHDGLDVMSFDLRAKPPKAPKPAKGLTAESVIERLASGKLTTQQQNKLDQLPEPERIAILRGIWDAFVAGTFGADASAKTYRTQLEFLAQTTQLATPVATHAHVVHALKTLDDNGRWLLGTAIVRAICALPASPEDDRVREALDPNWYERLVSYRFLLGAPDVWTRPLFDAAALADATRTYLRDARTIYGTGFDVMTGLLEGRELASAATRHYGQGALSRAHAAVTSRGLEAHARDAAAATLAELVASGANVLNDLGRNTRRLLALTFAILFRDDPNALPPDATSSLAYGSGYSQAAMSDADKALLASVCASLPDSEKAAVNAVFYLGL